jgi:class 3 adenylate cyclase
MILSGPTRAIIVSCDIVGHGADTDHQRQLTRLQDLNATIRSVCAAYFARDAVWASGGDGGHVAFLGEQHLKTALDLIQALVAWAGKRQSADGDPFSQLRISAHCGLVATFEGADGRRELAGDGINTSGSLIKFATPDSVLVTLPFRDLVESARMKDDLSLDAVAFDRERTIYLKHERTILVTHLSWKGYFESPESKLPNADRERLKSAIAVSKFWSALYYAKRLLQINSADADALAVLQNIIPAQLVIPSGDGQRMEAHPFFSQLNRQALQDLLLTSQLVERDDGDTICARGDPGDTMFVVLRGQIGVVPPPQSRSDQSSQQAARVIRFGEGSIVGELALALNRHRTADLQAIGSSAMLSINYAMLQALLNAKPKNVRLERTFSEFLLERALSFACSNSLYLAKAPESPLAKIHKPWDQLTDGAELISIDWRDAEAFFSAHDRFSAPGLYVLAGGRLIESRRTDIISKTLDADKIPIIFANLPGALVGQLHTYHVDLELGGAPVKVLYINDRALKSFGPGVYGRLVDDIRAAYAKQFLFDVFISYSHKDEPIATAWKVAFQGAGLSVYMSRPEAMQRFKSEIELALAESLVMVPFVSERAVGPAGQAGWVQREIEYRKTLFDEAHANILPIELTKGLAQSFADGFSAIPVSGDGLEGVSEAIEAIRAVIDGRKPPPYSLQFEVSHRI